MDKKIGSGKVIGVFKLILFVFIIINVFLFLLGKIAFAAGLVDDTVSGSNLYSKYALANYQLDFYVDNSWSWLPWNWLEGIGKSVQYGLYCITDLIWTISLYLSNAAGYIVQEAYRLDFLNDMAESIGKSMQAIAGISPSGITGGGFYPGFMLIIILITGIYVAYKGLIKRETSKAIHAVTNFLLIFILSASFIAYSPDYIQKVNDFSGDISSAALDVGTRITVGDAERGRDSIDMIRNDLFAIQVQKPWLLLQFGNSDTDEIGEERIEALLSADPSDDDGKTREEAVKTEIEDYDNDNLTIPKVTKRLGMVFFLFIFNIGITIFIFLLTGIMLFSQILFIIYAMFLPVSFLLAMIPGYEGMAKQAIVKVFNTIMTRAGITLIVTVAFCISSMFYNLSADYPFFMIAFLQIVCFAGIYMKLGDILGMFSLNASDSQSISRRIMKTPYKAARQGFRSMQRRAVRAMASNSRSDNAEKHTSGSSGKRTRSSSHSRGNTDQRSENKTSEKDGPAKDVRNIKAEQELRENVSSMRQYSEDHEDEERLNNSYISHMTEKGNHDEREATGRLQRNVNDDISENSINDNETLKHTENESAIKTSKGSINTDEPEPVKRIRPIISTKEHEDMKNSGSENNRAAVTSTDNVRPVVTVRKSNGTKTDIPEERVNRKSEVLADRNKPDIKSNINERSENAAKDKVLMPEAKYKERPLVSTDKKNYEKTAATTTTTARSNKISEVSTDKNRPASTSNINDKNSVGSVSAIKDRASLLEAKHKERPSSVSADKRDSKKADMPIERGSRALTISADKSRPAAVVKDIGQVPSEKPEKAVQPKERSVVASRDRENMKTAASALNNKNSLSSEKQMPQRSRQAVRSAVNSDMKGTDTGGRAVIRNGKMPVSESRIIRQPIRGGQAEKITVSSVEQVIKTERSVVRENKVQKRSNERGSLKEKRIRGSKKNRSYRRGGLMKKSSAKKGRKR